MDFLKCPFCDGIKNHILSVKVNAGGEITTVGYDGTTLEYGESLKTQKLFDNITSVLKYESITVLRFACDGCFKIWEMSFRSHNGHISIDMVADGDWDSEFEAPYGEFNLTSIDLGMCRGN